MQEKATLRIKGESYDFDVLTGTENEKGIDLRDLRTRSGAITLDPGYGNTGSTISNITFIDGEKGILQYRGYPIEELAEHSTFPETAYLVMYGKIPTKTELEKFNSRLEGFADLHRSLLNHFNAFPGDAPPMAILSGMLNAISCHHPELLNAVSTGDEFDEITAKILSKVRTVAACAYRTSKGLPFNYPNPGLNYTENFLHMMFSMPYKSFEIKPEIVRALDLFFILHADHEQNCSTSTLRMVGSSRANLFSSVSASVCALWGPLHGGANTAVIKMLNEIKESGKDVDYYISKAKDPESDVRLMGFGHRVYKNFDPRTKILKKHVDRVLKILNIDDPMLEIAMRLEEKALKDEYFVERKLFPNVDFYSGILLRAIGIPLDMFTVLFAIGRMPGWIANWKELLEQNLRIHRPRQVYTGPEKRSYVEIGKR
ncbi:MAG: citrate synthase [bacterium]|nr:citrate synthase [bacterium]